MKYIKLFMLMAAVTLWVPAPATMTPGTLLQMLL